MTTIVIMPGGFHPFHAGHYALYQSAQRTFPDAEVYVAATNDTSARPFPFPVKEKLAKLAGVEAGHFVQVKSPFRAEEITAKFDPARDTLIFVRSEKDSTKPPQPGGIKKDGSPSYLQPLLGAKKLEPFAKHAYMAYLPTVEFGPGMTSATEIRAEWPTLDEQGKLDRVMSLYPRTQGNEKLAATVVGLLDAAMGTQSVAETREKFNQAVMQPGFEFSQEIDGVTYEVTNDAGHGPVVTVTDKNNEVIAQAAFSKHKTRPGLESINTYVEPAWQGEGIASNMYAVMRMLGTNISPSTNQTDDGQAMWDKWNKHGDAKHIKSLNSKIKQQGVAEAVNPDILNKKFKHTQEIGDYTYTAHVEQGRSTKEPYPGAPITGADTPNPYYVLSWLKIRCFDGDKRIGSVVFEIHGNEKNQQWLESYGTSVDKSYEGTGIASTMYAYAKMLGNDIRPSKDLSFHGQRMWAGWRKSGASRELRKMSTPVQGVAEGAPIVVAQPPIHIRNPKKAPQPYRNQGDIVPDTKPPSTEKRGVKGRPGQRPMPKHDEGMAETSKQKGVVGREYDRDPELRQAMLYAKQHYPQHANDPEQAMLKWLQRGLNHSEQEDRQHDRRIAQLNSKVSALIASITQLKQQQRQSANENNDYLDE